MIKPKSISIFGSTGSIGKQALEVVRAFPKQFNLVSLSANKNITLLAAQLKEFNPQYVCIGEPSLISELESVIQSLGLKTKVVSGQSGYIDICNIPHDLIVMSIVGTAGLMPTVTAIKQKIPIALACKEVLVAAGPQVTYLANQYNVPIIPIDSEHAALKQCLSSVNEDISQVRKLILTASGGPFLELDKQKFETITPQTALKHPNWNMGGKISIDSATMMNKGLELIEAHFLFDIPYDKLDIIIHPQSIIHSLVEFSDGTMLSQLGLPDMRLPIQYAMTYPEKWNAPWPRTTLSDLPNLTFIKPDFLKFPLPQIAIDCGKKSQSYPVVMNAANEAAVNLFLDHQIKFNDIVKIIESTLSTFNHYTPTTIEEIILIDKETKEKVYESIYSGRIT